MAQNRGISTAVNAQTSENLPTCRDGGKRGILKDWAKSPGRQRVRGVVSCQIVQVCCPVYACSALPRLGFLRPVTPRWLSRRKSKWWNTPIPTPSPTPAIRATPPATSSPSPTRCTMPTTRTRWARTRAFASARWSARPGSASGRSPWTRARSPSRARSSTPATRCWRSPAAPATLPAPRATWR